jgi:hypothetical protein
MERSTVQSCLAAPFFLPPSRINRENRFPDRQSDAGRDCATPWTSSDLAIGDPLHRDDGEAVCLRVNTTNSSGKNPKRIEATVAADSKPDSG